MNVIVAISVNVTIKSSTAVNQQSRSELECSPGLRLRLKPFRLLHRCIQRRHQLHKTTGRERAVHHFFLAE